MKALAEVAINIEVWQVAKPLIQSLFRFLPVTGVDDECTEGFGMLGLAAEEAGAS